MNHMKLGFDEPSQKENTVEHAHSYNFIQMNNQIELPANIPQTTDVLEQLDILENINLIKLQSEEPPQKDNIHELKSCSSSVDNKNNNMERDENTTNFVLTNSSIYTANLSMKERLEHAAPYNIFFTKVPEASKTLTDPISISFSDLLCKSLGELETSLQMNFLVDINWLIEQYDVQNVGHLPLTILYGYEIPEMDEYVKECLPNVSCQLIKLNTSIGIHHSKIGIYIYKDKSLRVVVSTANLYYEDWNCYNQGLWISPLCPRLPDGSTERDAVGPTAFKTSLLNYMKYYNLPILNTWIDHIKMADFSLVKVFFVNSVPGRRSRGCHLHMVGELLSRHCTLPQESTPESEGPLSWAIMAQASSLGSFGRNADQWLRKTLLRSLASHNKEPLPANSSATLHVIYPSVSNVLNSYYGRKGGGCLPYGKNVNDKQPWLKHYLHEWKADQLGRSRAMPHVKSYCRVSPCLNKLAWFLLTSANISKSAWGYDLQRNNSISVYSYEAGVMFLPEFFDCEYFYIEKSDNYNGKLFPFIYDLPLSAYQTSDEPWCN